MANNYPKIQEPILLDFITCSFLHAAFFLLYLSYNISVF